MADKTLLEQDPSVIEINQSIEEYYKFWKNKDETENFDEQFDRGLASKEVEPDVKKELEETVEKLIENEIADMR